MGHSSLVVACRRYTCMVWSSRAKSPKRHFTLFYITHQASTFTRTHTKTHFSTHPPSKDLFGKYIAYSNLVPMKLLLLLCWSVAITRLVHAFDISLKMRLPSKNLSNDKKVSANHLFMSSTDDEGENDLSERPSKGLNELLTPSKDCKVNRMSGTDLGEYYYFFLSKFRKKSVQPSTLTARFYMLLAYIGDVVFELYVRSRHVWPSKRTSDLQNHVVAIVRGKCVGVGVWVFCWPKMVLQACRLAC